MTENQWHSRRLTLWIVCLLASIMILAVANSIIHYVPDTSGGTLFDTIGALLPYGLIIAIAVYYFMKSSARPSRSALGAPRFSVVRLVWYILRTVGAMVVAIVPFLILFRVLELSGIELTESGSGGIIVPHTRSNPTQVGSLSFDLWSSLAIFSVAFVFVTLLLATIVRGKEDRIEEITEELRPTINVSYEKGRFPDDPCRRAILSYYAKGRAHMVSQGIPLTEAMTPREFERNVIASHSKANENFTPLTLLFEEARYSIHNMGVPEKKEAKKHYESLMINFRVRKRVE